MPTSIDAAIKEALAAIESELESTDSEYSTSEESGRCASSEEDEANGDNDASLTQIDLVERGSAGIPTVNEREGQIMPPVQMEPTISIQPYQTNVNSRGSAQVPKMLSGYCHAAKRNSASQPNLQGWSSLNICGVEEGEPSGNGSGCSDSDSDDECSDDYDTDADDSDESSDISDDERYMMPPPTPVVRSRMSRSNSLPQFSSTEVEMNATQISVLLNQMRMQNPGGEVRTSSSAPHMRVLHLGKPQHIQGQSMESCAAESMRAGALSQLTFERGEGAESEATDDPSILLKYILEDAGYSYRLFNAEEVDPFFFEIDPKRVNSYSLDIIAAVKARDIEALRRMYFEEKLNMNCCNRFGESVLHAACRRGCADVVRFLIHEANVDLRVRDDYGRTPMHDACWTAEPNLELMQLLLEQWPDLLLVKDKRGFTPLRYVRKAVWGVWIDFLDHHAELTHPKLLLDQLAIA